jgi:Ca-activated chloride channel family protein
MKTTLPVLACSLALLLAGQEAPAYRSEVNLVNITAVVRSSSGGLLRSLNKDDFQVLEDGVPQTIHYFARETELPLNLGIIVDVSGSQEKFLKPHNRDVADFLKTVLRPSDRAFVICFGNHLRLVSEGSSSASPIIDGLEQFRKGSRHFPEIGPVEDRDLGTALYDALYFSMTDQLRTEAASRRALVVFSDGEENSSEHDLLEVIEEAQSTDTVIYCVRYREKSRGKLTARNKYGERVMKHIASLSGGADFDGLADPLNQVFGQISEELRSLYQIGYVSSNGNAHDGSFRKVTIACKQPGTTVRSKSGYYAR